MVILEHLDDLADDLTAGAVAVITDERIRVRRLLIAAVAVARGLSRNSPRT